MHPQRGAVLVCWAAALGFSVSTSLGGQPSRRDDKRAGFTLRLQSFFRDLRTVRIQVGDDSLTLLLDTGGGVSSITPSVAARLRCAPTGEGTGFRMSGERVTWQYCPTLEGTIGGVALHVAPLAVFDINALLPEPLRTLDGVLALDVFAGYVVALDLESNTFSVVCGAAAQYALKRNTLIVRLATGERGDALTAVARVDGRSHPLWFLLDSGNLRGTLVSPAVTRDSLLRIDAGRARLRVGEDAVVVDSVTEAPILYDGVLGSAFFRSRIVALDLRDDSRPRALRRACGADGSH